MTIISTSDLQDLKSDIDTIDDVVESQNNTATSKLGTAVRTLKGFNADGDSAISSFNSSANSALDQFELDADIAIANAGYQIVGDFSDITKAEITSENEVYTSKFITDLEQFVWRYTGSLPYTPTESTPVGGEWKAVAIGELQTIARSLNVADTAVIYSTDTVTLLDNVSYIYDAPSQTTWGVPTLDSAGKTISDVTGSALTTTGGTGSNIYTLSKTKPMQIFVSAYGTDSASVIAADAAAFAAGFELYIDVDIDISDYGNDFIRFTANWRGRGYQNTTVTCKNIQWVNQDNVSVTHIKFITDAPQTGGGISGYGGTNGFTTKSTTSGNIDFAAIIGLTFIGNEVVNTIGTTNCVKTEACDDMDFSLNNVFGGGISHYGNKEHRCDDAFSISKANTRANVVTLRSQGNKINGEVSGAMINKFDLLNLFGGVGGFIKGCDVRNSLFDAIDLFTSGESLIVSGNTIYNVSHIGIQAKVDTNANGRDSLGAGLNRRLVISDNIIEDVYPKQSSSGVTDINGIMILFSDDQNEIPNPTNSDFIRHVTCHDNVIVGVHDDSEHAAADCRISGISVDAFMSTVHNNIISGVRRQPSSTVDSTGVGISINSVGVGPVNNVDVSSNQISAQVIGIYVNGTVIRGAGHVNNINLNNNRMVSDDTTTNQGMSYAGIFISPGCKDIVIDGGSIDTLGSAIILRKGFDNVTIKNIYKLKATNHALQIEGYGSGLTFSSSKSEVGGKRVNIVTSIDSNWDTPSEDWAFENLRGSGDVDLTFSNTAVGGLNKTYLSDCKFTNDSRFMLAGFDNSGGNILTRFYGHDNVFTEMTGGVAMDLTRLSRFKLSNNHLDTNGNTGQLVSLPSSVEDGVINDTDGFTISALLMNITSATNVTERDSVIIA